MDFRECLYSRRSIRHFNDKVVSDDTIKEIINAGIYAPSACNFEAWKFIIIKNRTTNKEKIRNHIAVDAPYGILVLYRNDIYTSGYIYKDYCQSAAAAIQNMLLYITSIGLGAVWICDLPKPRKLKRYFNIPKNFDIIAYIAFGHPLENKNNTKHEIEYHYGDEESFKEHKRRFSIEQVICDNKFYAVPGDCTNKKFCKRKRFYVIRAVFRGTFQKLLGRGV